MPKPRIRLREALFIRKPKTPGFGISRNYYLSVLAATAQLPSVVQVVNPDEAGGAVCGFGVPLNQGAQKDDLGRPMERGVYAFAAKDRKTVLRAMVVPKDEAGFDPEAFALSAAARLLDPEVLSSIRATWTLIQLTFEAHDPTIYPSLDFLLDVAARLAMLTEGVVADPISQRYIEPRHLRTARANDQKLVASDFVSVKERVASEGIHLYTLGMQKFALPEFEVMGIRPDRVDQAGAFLLGLCQSALSGKAVSVGAKVGEHSSPLRVAEGGLDRSLWEGIACYELIPDKAHTATEAIEAWAAKLK